MTRADAIRLFVTLALLLLGAGACVADQTREAPPMSIDDAICRALANDSVIELARLSLDAAQIEYARQRSLEAITGTKVSETRTASDIKCALLAYSRDVNNAILGIIDDAYAFQVAGLRARMEEDQVASRQQSLELIISKEASGAAGKLDELAARAELNAAQTDLSKARRTTQQAQLRLTQRLALPQGRPVAIDGLPEFRDYVPPEDALARARAADPELAQRQTAVTLARLDLERARVGVAAPLDIRKAENGLAVAEAQLTKAENDLEFTLQSDLAEVQASADSYRSATMSLQLAQQRHDIILNQKGTGQKTDLDVLTDTVAVEESQANQLEALKGYWKALLTLKVLIGTDLRPAGGDVSGGFQAAPGTDPPSVKPF